MLSRRALNFVLNPLLAQAVLTTSAMQASAKGGSKPAVIDSAIHLWSTGAPPYPWAAPPPADLQTVATSEAYLAAARAAGVSGALVVQPANHMYDHSYVAKALKDHPDFFKGMGLANPTLPPAEAVAELEALHASGFVGVRFNAGNFADGLASDVGRALYKRCGELGMPVGVMAFKGLGPFVADLEALCKEYPQTTLVIDHLGFFRQPAIGGQLGDAAANDEASWKGLLALSAHPQVHVKVSALFRTSAEPPPFGDLAARLGALIEAYGTQRLMWGSDYPFALPGGFPLPEGVAKTPASMSYADAVAVPSQWEVPALDDASLADLMGGNAARLFGFQCA